MSPSDEQRRRLQRTKLAALVRATGGTPTEPVDLGASAAALAEGVAWVLADAAGPAGLAAALLWAERNAAESLVVLCDDGTAALARQASYFGVGDRPIEVREVHGAGSATVEPASLPPCEPSPEVPDDLVEILMDRGLEVVIEHGVVRAEVLGLEVARLVRWPTDVGGDGALHLEAGVGRFDRDAVAAVHPDRAPEESLDRAIEMVRAHRFPGAAAHPIQMLARERWLRAMLIADPRLVGASSLEPVDMTTERAGLKDSHPAAALGTSTDGTPMLVVCSTGIDLSLVPLAADTRALQAPSAELVLAVPGRDRHRATETLASMLHEPARVVPVPGAWA